MPIRLSAAEFARQFGGAAGVETARTSERAAKPQIRVPKPRTPNKTERAWMEQCTRRHPGCTVLYEPMTLYLPTSGTSYTPDVVCIGPKGEIVAIYETKGAYIHNERSVHAWKEAKGTYGFWPFHFAQFQKGIWAVV